MEFFVNFCLDSCKVADSKREEFRKYLEKAGVMDALTKGKLENLFSKREDKGVFICCFIILC